MPRILIQSWRFLPHSYALVNQFQCLELLRRTELSLFHQDVPYYDPKWRAVRGLLDAASEERLSQIPSPRADQPADVTFRLAFPYNLGPSDTPRTVVFGTAESTVVPSENIVGGKPLAQALATSDVVLVTPSNWSREGFINSGADPDRVYVVPHGVEPSVFHPPSPEQRAGLRSRTPWGNHFAFLHIGAMTGNKNIPLLLRAFAAVAEIHPEVRLVLKGLNALYASQQRFERARLGLTEKQWALIQPRLIFSGEVLPAARMAELYQSVDAYVTPYAAEAFNLPALEAAACGLPVICTAGGPTDDFTTGEFALPVAAHRVPEIPGQPGEKLAVDLDSLVAQMRRIVTDGDFRAGAMASGAGFVARQFNWKCVVDRLLKVLLPQKYGLP